MPHKVEPRLGPLAVDFIRPMADGKADKKSIVMTRYLKDAIRPLKKKHKVSLNVSDYANITLPRLFLDEQLCVVGYITFEEMVSTLDKTIQAKKELVEETIEDFEELKRTHAWWIVYSTLEFRDRRTEILVPSKNVQFTEKNLRVQANIKREGYPNTIPMRRGIMYRFQNIYDFRDEDITQPDKGEITSDGVMEQW